MSTLLASVGESEALMPTEQNAPACKLATVFELDEFTFEGLTFEGPDGLLWEIKQSLSPLKLQQEHAPCEARQVHVSASVEDPANEAVVKLKYQ